MHLLTKYYIIYIKYIKELIYSYASVYYNHDNISSYKLTYILLLI